MWKTDGGKKNLVTAVLVLWFLNGKIIYVYFFSPVKIFDSFSVFLVMRR